MATNVVKLRQQRHTAIEAAREILDEAERDGRRRVTDEERRAFNVRQVEVSKLSREIEAGELSNQQEISEYLESDEKRQADSDDEERPGILLRDAQGLEYRAVAHDVPIRKSLGHPKSSLSLGRLLRGQATGIWAGADEERNYLSATGTAGGYTLGTEFSSEFIDLTRAKSVVSAAGAKVIGIGPGVDELHMAVVESRPTAGWVQEGSRIDKTQGAFGLLRFRPRLLAVYCKISIQLLRDSSNAAQILEQTLSEALALKLDESALNGDGTAEEPTGLRNSDQVVDYPVGGIFTFDQLIGCKQTMWQNDVEPSEFIGHPNLRGYIAKTKDGKGNYLSENVPEWTNLHRQFSSQLSSTAHTSAYVGTFENVFFVVRSDLEIQMSDVADDVFRSAQVAVRAMLRIDFGVARQGDVYKMSGITGTT